MQLYSVAMSFTNHTGEGSITVKALDIASGQVKRLMIKKIND
jgi:hypothetical protein